MFIYRLCRESDIALDGEESCQHGGRWNSKGKRVVYASSTLSLAALEYLVHLDPGKSPDDLMAVTIEIPEECDCQSVDARRLPPDWHTREEVEECRATGDAWLDELRSPLLAVPSAPMPMEWNYLINPVHEQSARIRIAHQCPFRMDPRLLEW